MSVRKYIVGPVLSVLFALFILILSVIPTDSSGEPPWFYFPGMDKFIHAGMYGTLTFLVLSMYLRKESIKYITYIFWISAILIYSILMEIIQYYFIEYRSGDIKDVYANLAGILLAWILILVYRKVKS